MNAVVFAMLGWMEMVVIALVVLLFFGAKRLPEIFKGMGQGIKEFKKATRDVNEDLQRAIDEEEPPRPRKIASKPQEPKV
ncbi:MAG: twin-arginine translocase TatA/TatE family subunit [Pedosphaera parvula]|nr:twin-arginine translocase TatA/TatE family subunit [Pedosphaera parvula]